MLTQMTDGSWMNAGSIKAITAPEACVDASGTANGVFCCWVRTFPDGDYREPTRCVIRDARSIAEAHAAVNKVCRNVNQALAGTEPA